MRSLPETGGFFGNWRARREGERMTITLVRIDALRQHEQVLNKHMMRIQRDLVRDDMIKDPIIVDQRTMVILDGHHRYNALKRMGYKYVPVYLVDYSSDRIAVVAWRTGEHVTKAEVMRAGLTGNLMPAKTSRHIVPDRPHGVNVPLAVLKEKSHDDKFHLESHR
jgi:L-serine kinase (ADP)